MDQLVNIVPKGRQALATGVSPWIDSQSIHQPRRGDRNAPHQVCLSSLRDWRWRITLDSMCSRPWLSHVATPWLGCNPRSVVFLGRLTADSPATCRPHGRYTNKRPLHETCTSEGRLAPSRCWLFEQSSKPVNNPLWMNLSLFDRAPNHILGPAATDFQRNKQRCKPHSLSAR
jgi:hypothetical protein